MTDNRKSLIEYRLTQAKDSLKEADVLHKSGMSLRSVMNRLYYSMFYTVLALLQNKELGDSNRIRYYEFTLCHFYVISVSAVRHLRKTENPAYAKSGGGFGL